MVTSVTAHKAQYCLEEASVEVGLGGRQGRPGGHRDDVRAAFDQGPSGPASGVYRKVGRRRGRRDSIQA